MTWLDRDPGLVDDICARMDLRAPNAAALASIVEHISVEEFREVVADLATGVGKTYLAAGLVEYLAAQGIRNILVVTPGTTIRAKTVDNFTPGHPKYVAGAEHRPLVITGENFARGQVGDALAEPSITKLFVFNVQQLLRPTARTSRRIRETDEFIGGDLYSHLQQAEDLVVIADEHHVYREQARAFSAAIRDLAPRALVGLTATPDPPDHNVVYRYSLAEAIADGLVKIPVIVYRQDGHTDVATQLADACHLRAVKHAAYQRWAEASDEPVVHPVLFVVCQTVADAHDAAELLSGPSYLADPDAVLEVTSQSSDDALLALAAVEDPRSPIRAVVSVDKLTEGWDVKNIGVIVALRRLASQALTEQILGRGLRLPYGRRVGVPMIDQVDLVAHDSYKRLLEQKDALIQKVVPVGDDAFTGAPTDPQRDAAVREAASHTTTETSTTGGTPAGGGNPTGGGTQPALRIVTPPRIVDGETVDGAAALIMQEYTEAAARGSAAPTVMRRVEGAPQIVFPRREQQVLPVRFSLSLVADADAQAAGAGFAHEIRIPLVREALTAVRSLSGEVTVRRQAEEASEATQAWVPVKEVSRDLVDRVLGLGLVEESLPELNAANRVVRAFLTGAGARPDSEVSWGAERAHQAVHGIGQLIRDRYNARRLQPEYVFRTVTLPVEPRLRPADVLDRFDTFERGRFYSGWRRSILPVASFDAKTTEYTLANILDSATGIQWWLRLQRDDPAYIELDTGGRYYPDFIAVDTNDERWLIEGKSDHDVARDDVRAKRRAAEEWATFVNDDSRFGTWHYLFCSETAIKNARGGWDSLLTATRAQPRP